MDPNRCAVSVKSPNGSFGCETVIPTMATIIAAGAQAGAR
jgi:hypothetical protein